MKRTFSALVLILAAASLFAQNSTAVIKEFTGTVELKPNSSANWVPARAGAAISKSTIVSTGFRSTAILTIGNSTLTVHPLTRLTLEELMNQNQSETVNLKLNTGKVRVEVAPPSGGRTNFNVQSPSATASVRGTSFTMDSNSIQVQTGAVGYSSANGSVTVSAGNESYVTEDGSVVSALAALEAAVSPAGKMGRNSIKSKADGSLEIEIELVSK